MMKKLLVICAWALFLGSCENNIVPETPTGKPEPPAETPISPEVQQKITEFNTGLVSLKELDAAVSRTTVKSLTTEADQTHLIFRDGTQATLLCQANAPIPMLGILADEGIYFWTLAAQPQSPWLKDDAGNRLPLSGPVPVLGVDKTGYWTVTTDPAGIPWQITDPAGKPIKATGTEPTVLFRTVVLTEGRVEISMANGGEFSVAKIEDLSAAATANSYVVSTPGSYLFKATVRGNGVGDAATTGTDSKIEVTTDMTADWLWADAADLISDISFAPQLGEITFTAGSGRGNVLIALMQGNEVVWSWHIWMTAAPQTMVYENGTISMDRNLGAISSEVGSTDAYGMYYQWGRKDPFYGGQTTETSATAFAEAKKHTIINPAYADYTWSAATGTFSTADYAAAHPMTFLYNKVGVSAFYDWLATPRATMWSAAKSLNDPCPPGYKIPQTNAWADFGQGRQYIDGVSAWDGTHFGMTYTFNGQTTWYPAQGYRNQSTGSIIGLGTTRTGNYWAAEAASQTARFFYFQKKLTTSSGSINHELDKSRAFGYTVRCCKE